MRRELEKGKVSHLLLTGVYASTRALVLTQVRRPLFILLDNSEAAQYLYADLKVLSESPEANVFFFPSSKRRRTTDEAMVIQRTEVLAALSRLATTPSTSPIVVTYPEALSETVPAKNELSAISFQLSTGQEIAHSALSKQLLELGFEQVDFVFQPGQYAIRGSIVDIYSYSHDIPYRLDFFGDEIDSIREFDIEDQLSKTKVEKAEIVGAQNTDRSADRTQTYIPAYLTDDFIWVSNDWSIVRFKLDGLGVMDSIGAIETHKTIELNEKSTFPTHSKITLDIVPQPLFHKQFDLLTGAIWQTDTRSISSLSNRNNSTA